MRRRKLPKIHRCVVFGKQREVAWGPGMSFVSNICKGVVWCPWQVVNWVNSTITGWNLFQEANLGVKGMNIHNRQLWWKQWHQGFHEFDPHWPHWELDDPSFGGWLFLHPEVVGPVVSRLGDCEAMVRSAVLESLLKATMKSPGVRLWPCHVHWANILEFLGC